MSAEPRERGPGDFGWSLGVLLRAYQSSMGAAIGDLPHGHRGYQVLSSVVHGEQPSQLALAEHLGIDRTVMTYLIDDLVAAGLVERRPNPADRRQRRIVPTEPGARTLEDLERQVHAAEDAVLGALAPPERALFRALLNRIACDVRGIEPQRDPCDVVSDLLDNSSLRT